MYNLWIVANGTRNGIILATTYMYMFVCCIRASVDALSRDGTDMRGDAQNPKSFQAPRM